MTGLWAPWPNLGYEVSDQTVGNVLQRHGVPPAPERKRTTTWAEFIQAHLAVLAGTDFFTVEVLTLRGLVTYYVLFFIHLESRRVDIAGITVHPNEQWMKQMARNATMEEWGTLRDCRYLLHDRDTKYTQSFRAIIKSGRVKTLMLPAHSPNLNAYAERWVRSVKEECLSKLILIGERSLRRALSAYVAHYHAERNHQGQFLDPTKRSPRLIFWPYGNRDHASQQGRHSRRGWLHQSLRQRASQHLLAHRLCPENPQIRRALANSSHRALPGQQKPRYPPPLRITVNRPGGHHGSVPLKEKHMYCEETAWNAPSRRTALVRHLLAAGMVLALMTGVGTAEPAEITIGYLRLHETNATISLLDMPTDNDGVAGAILAIEDNNTTGRFLNQRFLLKDIRLKATDNLGDAVAALAERGISIAIADLPADALLQAADAGHEQGLLIFNAGAIDDRLREEDCRANVVHAAPTRSMLADGLAQYLVWKKWGRWLLVVGSHPKDKLFANALRRAAMRFGAKIVQERVFEDTGGARRTDSGIVQVQRQIPLFTQSAPDYDVLVAADESEVFASYLPYRTRDPRPVAGSAGLVPKSWDPAHDQWGANQLQNRFVAKFSRRMNTLDGQSWTAGRMIGEATTRTHAADPKAMLAYLKSAEFKLASFKGQGLTLRDWNLQLRQPVLLSDGRVIVSVSPQEGFLHQFSELDTLGYDRPETKCRLN
jgi:ABC transporter substrate binding protein (PQQ-dependent alcohol dehydrogenase system)